MVRLNGLFGRSRKPGANSAGESLFQRKYTHFRGLLAANNSGMKIVGELESLLLGHTSFSLDHVVDRATELIGAARDVVSRLEGMTGVSEGLLDRVEEIGALVLGRLTPTMSLHSQDLVLPTSSLNRTRLDDVGGKAANIGEVGNRVGLPVPPGFAITARSCRRFLAENGLDRMTEERLAHLDVRDTDQLVRVCEEIRGTIIGSPIPPDIKNAMDEATSRLLLECGPSLRLSVRSSATCEDSEASFAGQHASVLNVLPDEVAAAYREVVASVFTPRAVFYRRTRGYTEQDVLMSVLCLSMVDAVASGVLYTVDPNRSDSDDLLVSAAWGLGVSVVDGSGATDLYRYSRAESAISSFHVARKERQVVMAAEGGLADAPVDPALRDKACMTNEQALHLIDYGFQLEAHYGVPLDIEWALDRLGRIIILQARPLCRTLATSHGRRLVPPHEIEAEILLAGGNTACRGPAGGPAHVIRSDSDIRAIPEGCILVAPQTSPAYVAVMGSVRGIITDIGSVTGHMATVAREFRIPTLVGMGNATSTICPGQNITLDASNRIVYEGSVPEVVERRRAVNPMKGSPVYRMVSDALQFVSPLNLTDPAAPNFGPSGIVTIHDVIRYTHEQAMREMFRIGGSAETCGHRVMKLKSGVPMPILVIDLGGGLVHDSGKNGSVSPSELACAPFLALWRGFTHPGVNWRGTINFGLGEFMSTMAMQSTMAQAPGGDSYAIITSDYMNLSARFGYHFAILDAYASADAGANHAILQFGGGIGSFESRSLRVLFLSEVLSRLGFVADIKGDHLEARINDLERSEMESVLDQVGRLLASSRLLDVLLTGVNDVDHLIDRFFAGEYDYLCHSESSRLPGFYSYIGNWSYVERDGRQVIVTDNAGRVGVLSAAVAGVIGRIAGESRKNLFDWTGTDLHFPLAVLREPRQEDGSVSVVVTPRGGTIEQSGGIAFALENVNTYFVFAMNARSGSLALHRFEEGCRRVPAKLRRTIELGRPHELRVETMGTRVVCSFDGEPVFEYLAERPLHGWVGLWSRADSVTEFSELTLTLDGVPAPVVFPTE